MRLTHKGNQVDSQKYVEIGNLYDKDYRGGTGGKFIQTPETWVQDYHKVIWEPGVSRTTSNRNL